MSKFKVGDFVIVNDCDAPMVRLIAIIIAVTQEVVNGESLVMYKYCYISTYTTMRFGQSTLERGNNINEWGLRMIFFRDEDNSVTAKVMPLVNFIPTATYPDGSSRAWQDNIGATTAVADEAKRYILLGLIGEE